jgi:hypothetical protein
VEDGPANKSFGVCYLRKADLVAGKPTADALNNPLNPSRRRFATEAEADKHGSRFRERKASYGAAPGSAGHIGFYTIETNDPVNSVISSTGKTIPAPGQPRTFSERQAAGTTNAQLLAKKN